MIAASDQSPTVSAGSHQSPTVSAGSDQRPTVSAGSDRNPAVSAASGQLARAGEPLLEVRGLCADYGVGAGAVHAVRDADLVLHAGEVLGLAGESGSGKSTLAYAITRLLRAPGMITGGTVHYHPEPGKTVDLLAIGQHDLRVLRWSQISVVMQSAMNALNPVLSIGAQLTDVLQAHMPELDARARRARGAELLNMVGITADRLRGYPHELSGGMRQRVMIAMALALRPQIVIMDEPTTALDVVTQREILLELTELRQQLGFAVLFITHDLSLLIEIADSIAVMYAGRVVERAEATALFHAPRHPYSLGLLSSFPPLHGPRRHLTGIPGSPPDLRELPPGCVFHPRCPYVMDKCRTDLPPLAELGEAGARLAACWLQDGTAVRPAELAAPAPGADPRETAPREAGPRETDPRETGPREASPPVAGPPRAGLPAAGPAGADAPAADPPAADPPGVAGAGRLDGSHATADLRSWA